MKFFLLFLPLFPLRVWADHQPSGDDLAIGHRFDLVGPIAEDQMVVVGEHGVGEDVDREVAGEVFQPLVEPIAPMGVVDSGGFVVAAKKATADDAIEAVIDADDMRIEDIGAFGSGHDDTPWTEEHYRL